MTSMLPSLTGTSVKRVYTHRTSHLRSIDMSGKHSGDYTRAVPRAYTRVIEY